MKKPVVIILICLGVLVVGGIGTCVVGGGLLWYATADLPKAADAFFAAVQKKDYDGAYQQTAPAFKAATTKDQMTDALTASGLVDYSSASWPIRSFENDQGYVQGTVVTTKATSLPVKVSLIKEAGVWKVMGFKLMSGAETGNP